MNLDILRRNFTKIFKFKQITDEEYHPQTQSKTLRKKKGIYYTPKEITSYICIHTLMSYLMQLVGQNSNLFDPLPEASPQKIQQILHHLTNVRLLDPACGAGNFLIQAAEILFQLQKFFLDRLGNSNNVYELKRNILLNNIYGVDLFEDAVSTTKSRLVNWLRDTQNSEPNSGQLDAFDWKIKVGNSLLGWLDEDLGAINSDFNQLINKKFIESVFGDKSKNFSEDLQNEIQNNQPFHWNLEFKSVMEKGGFDIIVGNPPYVFIRGKNFSPFEIQFYKEKYLKNYESLAKGKARQSRKLNSFSLFIIRSVALLKLGGYLGFIVPNTLLRTTTNDYIRQFIIKNTHVQEIVDLKEGIFKGITASTILLFLQKTTSSTETTLIKYNVQDLLNHQFNSHQIHQSNFLKNPVFAFSIHLTPEFEKAFAIMKQNTFELGSITREIIEGIVCRKSDNLFITNNSHPLSKKLLRGKDIGRYQINWPSNQYIIYAVDTSHTKTKLHRPRPQWVHDALEKYLTQRIGGGIYPIKVAHDTSQYYTFASINNIIFKSPLIYEDMEYLPKYILALLNSKLMNAYYLLHFSNLSSLTVNISKTFLESLPIKKADLKIQALITRIAEYLLFLYTHPKKNFKMIEFFDFWILDSLIYELYYQEQLGTNLLDKLPSYIPDLLPTEAIQEQSSSYSRIQLTIQQEPRIIQAINKIKKHPLIKKIELLFHERNTLLKNKSEIRALK